MAAFLGKISMVFNIAMIGSGLVVLYYARKEASALLKAAGYLFLIGGISLAICTGYYSMKYHFQGDFERAYFKKPAHHRPWDRGDKVRRHHKDKHGDAKEMPRDKS